MPIVYLYAHALFVLSKFLDARDVASFAIMCRRIFATIKSFYELPQISIRKIAGDPKLLCGRLVDLHVCDFRYIGNIIRYAQLQRDYRFVNSIKKLKVSISSLRNQVSMDAISLFKTLPFPQSLKELDFFNTSHDFFDGFDIPQVKTLRICGPIYEIYEIYDKKYTSNIKFPNSLIELHMDKFKLAPDVLFPATLQVISTDMEINCKRLPPSLTVLRCKLPRQQIKFPSSLTELSLPSSSLSLPEIILPPNIKKLSLGSMRRCDLPNINYYPAINFPASLTELKLLKHNFFCHTLWQALQQTQLLASIKLVFCEGIHTL